MKGLTANPYLKIYPHQTMYEGKEGATFTDEEQKFRYLVWNDVEEL